MKKTLVWELIAGFSNSEIRRFRRFLDSPYFNQREDLRRFFDLLLKMKTKGKTPIKEFVFEVVFDSKEFDSQLFRLTLSYFLKVLEQFLIIEKLQENNLEKEAMLLSVYREKNLTRHFQKTLNRTEKSVNKETFRHPEFYLSNFKLEQEKLLFQAKSGRTKAVNVQEVEDNLDYAFMSMKLRQACTSLSHQAVFNTKYRIDLMDEILEKAAQPDFLKIPAIAIYYYCYMAVFKEESEENFQKFKTVLFENTHQFPKEEMRSLYLLILNFCIKKINENQRTYLREALDLYKKGLEELIIFEREELSHFTYNNIVAIAMHLGELEWAESFVKNYKNTLNTKWKEVTFNLNSARLAFAQKQFDKALQFLQNADYEDIINNMAAKILLMKIYFESAESDLLDAHLKTMEMFIRRNKKIGYHYQNWKNIVRFTRKLMETNFFDRAAIEKLKLTIQQETILTEKDWLLKQIA